MDRKRAVTTIPSFRENRLQSLKNIRMKTDVTFLTRKPFLGGNGFAKSSPAFSFGRPLTTIGCTRKNQKCEAPENFSWVDEGWIAGCAMPTTAEHYRFLFEKGIRHIISLTKHQPEGAVTSLQVPKINRIKIRIADSCAPTIEQIKMFLKFVEIANYRKEAVVVHCTYGKGRTGTMLACYLMKHKRLNAAEALEEVRRLRPGSVETHEQEKAISQFYISIKSGER